MKKSLVYLFVMALVCINSCAAPGYAQSTLAPQSYPLENERALTIEINTGDVRISGNNSDKIELSGSLTTDPALVFSVQQTPTGLKISAQYPKRIFPAPAANPIHLELRVPKGVRVLFTSQEANLSVKDFIGDLDVTATAGDVEISGMNGKASVKANRGDVTIKNSAGEFYELGNYGLLSLIDVHGSANASTIMGTVRYQGLAGAGDRIRLETDHGPIQIDLDAASDLTVQLSSTSGDVLCTFAALNRQVRTCSGKLSAGSGDLIVRTVSGSITLKSLP